MKRLCLALALLGCGCEGVGYDSGADSDGVKLTWHYYGLPQIVPEGDGYRIVVHHSGPKEDVYDTARLDRSGAPVEPLAPFAMREPTFASRATLGTAGGQTFLAWIDWPQVFVATTDAGTVSPDPFDLGVEPASRTWLHTAGNHLVAATHPDAAHRFDAAVFDPSGAIVAQWGFDRRGAARAAGGGVIAMEWFEPDVEGSFLHRYALDGTALDDAAGIEIGPAYETIVLGDGTVVVAIERDDTIQFLRIALDGSRDEIVSSLPSLPRLFLAGDHLLAFTDAVTGPVEDRHHAISSWTLDLHGAVTGGPHLIYEGASSLQAVAADQAGAMVVLHASLEPIETIALGSDGQRLAEPTLIADDWEEGGCHAGGGAGLGAAAAGCFLARRRRRARSA